MKHIAKLFVSVDIMDFIEKETHDIISIRLA